MEQREQSGRDVGEDAIFHAHAARIGRDVDEVDEIGGVGGVGGAVGVAHLFAVPVVGGEEGFAARGKERGDDAADAFVDGLDGFDAGFDDAGVADHVGIGEV